MTHHQVSPGAKNPFGRQHTHNTAPLLVPLIFLMTGQLGWLGELLLLALHPRALVAGNFGRASLIAATHLFTLGFLTMTIMGILHQLVPVTLNLKPRRTSVVMIQYTLMTMGTGSFTGGFLAHNPWFIALGASSLSLAILLFVVLIAGSLRKAQDHPFHSRFIQSALGYLTVTVVLGLMLAWNFISPWGIPPTLLLSHIAVAVGGFAGFLLMGLSYKLSIMFFPSKSAVRHGEWVFNLLHGAVIAEFLAGLLKWHFAVIGGVLALMASFGYVWDVLDLWRQRRNAYRDPVLYTVGLGTVFFIVDWLLMGVIILSHRVFLIPAVAFLLFNGWFGFSILGYTQKILPFVLWLHRYSHVHGRGKVPRLNEIFPEDWSWHIIILSSTGLMVAELGLMLQLTGVFATGVCVLAAGVLRMHGATWRAVLRRPAHREDYPTNFISRLLNW